MKNLIVDHDSKIGSKNNLKLGGNCQDSSIAFVAPASAVSEQGSTLALLVEVATGALSDGCSSANGSDLGSLAIVRGSAVAAGEYLKSPESLPNLTNFLNGKMVGEAELLGDWKGLQRLGVEAIMVCRTALKLVRENFAATKINWIASENGAIIEVGGDGVLAVKKADGSTVIINHQWVDEKPFYPIYHSTDKYKDSFASKHGGRDKKALKVIYYSHKTEIDKLPKLWETPDLFGMGDHGEEPDLNAIKARLSYEARDVHYVSDKLAAKLTDFRKRKGLPELVYEPLLKPRVIPNEWMTPDLKETVALNARTATTTKQKWEDAENELSKKRGELGKTPQMVKEAEGRIAKAEKALADAEKAFENAKAKKAEKKEEKEGKDEHSKPFSESKPLTPPKPHDSSQEKEKKGGWLNLGGVLNIFGKKEDLGVREDQLKTASWPVDEEVEWKTKDLETAKKAKAELETKIKELETKIKELEVSIPALSQAVAKAEEDAKKAAKALALYNTHLRNLYGVKSVGERGKSGPLTAGEWRAAQKVDGIGKAIAMPNLIDLESDSMVNLKNFVQASMELEATLQPSFVVEEAFTVEDGMKGRTYIISKEEMRDVLAFAVFSDGVGLCLSELSKKVEEYFAVVASDTDGTFAREFIHQNKHNAIDDISVGGFKVVKVAEVNPPKK